MLADRQGKKRKGQLFLLGTFLLALMFFLGLPVSRPSLSIPTKDLAFYAVNVERELPRALNMGLNQSDWFNVMEDFTGFVRNITRDHYINFTTLWIVAGNSSSDLNVTTANHLGYDTNLNLTVAGTKVQMPLANGAVNYTIFADPGVSFTINITFGDFSSSYTWVRDKVNLYAFIKLQRENDFRQEHITA